MSTVVFIGDELSAAGYRLAGIETVVAEPPDMATAFAEARARASLVIVTAALRGQVPGAEFEAATLAEKPAVAVVPDVLFHASEPDLADRLRRLLGIEA